MFPVFWPMLWSVCWATAIVTAVLALRSRRAMYVGRAAVATLMLVGGALFNAGQLASGNTYSDFADDALFRWVTDAWVAVVPANHVVLITLLVVFEVTVGVLILSGGRGTQVGYLGAIAFHVALWLFGWFLTVYCLLMVPALVLLLVAERRTTPVPLPSPAPAPARVAA